MAVLTKKRYPFTPPEHRYEYDFWTVRKCKLSKQCVEQLSLLLASLADSYSLMVRAADEYNRISLARRSDVEDAIERASNLGEIIDDIIKKLDNRLDDYLDVLCKCDFEIQLVRQGISLPQANPELQESLEFEAKLLTSHIQSSDAAPPKLETEPGMEKEAP